MYLYTDQVRMNQSRLAQPRPLHGLGLPPVLPMLPMACSFTRTCCVLAPYFIIDPSSLGTHRSASERNGIIYTGGAGFIDTSHVRHCCDDTKRVYDQLAASKGSPAQVSTSHGVATIKATVPATMWPQVARAISYSDSVGYEIESYWSNSAGGHNSAFSPEDLCSNYLGTYIAESAINIPVVGPGANFNASVTATLNGLLTVLKAQPTAETQNAFNVIMNCWMSPNPAYSTLSIDAWGHMTLKRRNFSILPMVPWKVGHPSDFPTPSWLTRGLGTASSYYAYTFTACKTPLPETNFGTEISKIRQNAATRYPNKYDQPACP
jgi:Protein of unknown function (DUF4056)